MNRKNLTTEQVLQKLRHYCRYQERCSSDVRSKLFELGVSKQEHDHLIDELMTDDYLNEERFAMAFATGRFKMKKWGRRKILYELKEKRVSEGAIRKGLDQIQQGDYMQTLEKLTEEKYGSLKAEQYLIRKKKTMDYLMQRGFEPELIKALLEK